MMTFLCSNCGASLQCEQGAGVKGRCPRCKQKIEAPVDSLPPDSGSLRKTPPPVAQLEETCCPSSSAESPLFQEAEACTAKDLSILTPTNAGEMGQIGQYRVVKVLGSGGMGVVFQAEDTMLERPVALKCMKPELAAREDHRRRFLREARAAASIDHPHIVTIYQVGDHKGIPYLAMKLLRGESLEERLNRLGHPLPIADVVRIGMETAEGLAAAHERGLIHRDIKPANIWLEEGRDWVRIVDFGLARGAEEDASLTQTGIVVGTPAYMAPEQANGDPLDHRCDLFSFGTLLFRMSTGQLPFKGKNSLSMLHALITQTPPTPISLVPTLPPAFSDLVMSLLRKKPAKRPATAEHVRQALECIAEQLTQPSRPDSSPVIKVQPAARPATTSVSKVSRPAPTQQQEVIIDVLEEVTQEVSVARSSGRPRHPDPRPKRSSAASRREKYWERKVMHLAILVGILIFLLICFLIISSIVKSYSARSAAHYGRERSGIVL
jgi:serine/threonine protein kinase